MVDDYFIDMYYVDKIRQPDGTGGFEYTYKVGEKFRGSAMKSSTAEQTLAGVRGVPNDQYSVITYKNNVLEASDIIMFVDQNGKKVYLKINSNPSNPPEISEQDYWKYATATEFYPDLRVVE